jgi:biotin carboxylase
VSVLVLHRNPLEPFPYDKWLADYDGDVVVLAARDRIELVGEPVPTDNLNYTRLEILDRFDTIPLRTRALELATEFGVTRVIAHHESDVESAAWLRERLGLPGAWSADVAPFRDKVLMKQEAGRAGVPIAPHTAARTARQVRQFADRHGFPVVLKERAGCNSIGMSIVHDSVALEECLKRAYGDSTRDDLLVEAFVPGRMCHVDGLVVAGRTVVAWPSQYQYDLASYDSDPGARIDLTLDPDDPLTDRLLAFTEQALAALRTESGRLRDHAFHAEIFHTPDDRLVLCEIACRPGGAKIREVFHTMFGVNLAEYTTRAQMGLPLPALDAPPPGGGRPTPRAMSGQLLMMKRPGLVRRLPAPPDESWVRWFWLYARTGDVIPPAAGSADFLTAVVASAPNRTECERRLRALGSRFESQVEIVGAP